ncbi:site-specific integrase [Companilactobacillus sp.]|jgi:integrase|uniref:site-specific integrase n=1 Tax=Companilactobacillus sp. TaxID=2767905 RepID=UPI0025B90C1F|nr:site-specific integrase [Companilactobacillus sp.]MCH4008105.1 site-specific integrase [Companilactobacillus sp.]MCH4051716.1 site-specific integrase [Companilactobacillus sp.]MCH4076048.1 site-specific integrase [Companilactobacillus sp.]MCH4124623.1 site-specific integrase [Companilactobacillus sp.]MCH4132414.1 site-specific integrase [Companilactobacillus sp.]
MANFEKVGRKWKYRIKYKDADGKWKSKTKSFNTKKEAKVAANEMENSLIRGSSIIDSNTTFYDYYRNWVNVYKKPNVGKTSMNRFNNIATVINNYFPLTRLNEVTKMQYQEFMNDYMKTRSTLTCEKTNGIIRSCVQDAIDDQIIYSDFTRKVKISGTSKRKKSKKYLSISDFQKVIGYTNKHKSYNSITYYEVLTGAYTGLRFEEISGLRWSAIDFKSKTITVDSVYDYMDAGEIQQRTKSKTSKRVIPLLDELAVILKQLKMEQNEWLISQSEIRNNDNIVFLSKNGKIPSDAGLIKSMKYIQTQVGIPTANQIRPHGLRHTFASYLLSTGVQMKYVSQFLGHANTMITSRVYEHLLEEQDKEQTDLTIQAMERLSK